MRTWVVVTPGERAKPLLNRLVAAAVISVCSMRRGGEIVPGGELNSYRRLSPPERTRALSNGAAAASAAARADSRFTAANRRSALLARVARTTCSRSIDSADRAEPPATAR